MPDPHSLERLRPCGHLERFSTARHHLGFYNNVAFSASYAHPSCSIPLQHLIFHALRSVISQHPILSAIPVDEDKKETYFARLPEIDLRTCTVFKTREKKCGDKKGVGDDGDEEVDALLQEQHNLNFKEGYGEKAFWRLIILSSPGDGSDGAGIEFMANWVFHHAIGDGTSGMVFHRSFLAALQAIGTSAPDVNAEPIVKSPQAPLFPTIEDLHPLPLSVGYLAKQLWDDWFPKNQKGVWTGGKVSDDPKFTTRRFRSLVFSKETTKMLLEKSREHKTSLTGTLQCIVAAATFFNLDSAKWDSLHVGGAISLRRFVELSTEQGDIEDVIGCWTSQYIYDHHRPATSSETPTTALDLFSWTEAQNVRKTIIQELDKDLNDSVVNLLRWVSDLHSFFEKKVGKERGDSFELSNVGVFKGASGQGGEDDWRIGRCVFSQGAPVVGAAFEVSVVTGGDECLVLGLSWMEGIVDGEFLERVVEDVRGAVEGLVGGGK